MRLAVGGPKRKIVYSIVRLSKQSQPSRKTNILKYDLRLRDVNGQIKWKIINANWDQKELKKLEENIEKYGEDWKQVVKGLPGKTCQQVRAEKRKIDIRTNQSRHVTVGISLSMASIVNWSQEKIKKLKKTLKDMETSRQRPTW
ncbi:4416_t:CDS:2 [Paraglomus brasilianum]|uniref:4416_t:CDS:1 n=1 Tax=Paraglomus brasilianum TaxID=144538 RepID=A0A9N9AFA0_9GLOM|nr:4416_t:CDS:2 [Paraglomus brasilianum]